jgi:L-alanine-DL-glutamate epimerase-like enolase superfamily enzyme
MKIQSVTATPFRIPFSRKIALSTGVREAAEHVLIEVVTEDGVSGHAECVPRPTLYGETVETAVAVIEHVVAPALIGKELAGVAAIAGLVNLKANPAARSSVEIAVFDALAKTFGVPAFALLGGYVAEIRCCPLLGYGRPDDVVAEATALQSDYGVDTIKFKIGPDLRQDIGVARALRRSLGDNVELYADANGRYSAADAGSFLAATADLRLRFLEEPSVPDDLLGRQRLVRSSAIPILGDESCINQRAVASEVLAGRSSGVSIKLARTGISASLQIRDFCSTMGLPVIVGSQGDSALGTLASAAFAASAAATGTEAAEVMFFLQLEDDLLASRPVVAGGKLALPNQPGFGYEFDPDKLDKYRLSGSS